MIVFQHLPKTAGTYIHERVSKALGDGGVIHCENDSIFLNRPAEAFSSARLVCGHLSTRAIKFRLSDPQVVTCLREPVDRVISAYFYWRSEFPHNSLMGNSSRQVAIVDQTADPYADLERCICSDELPIYDELRNLQTWILGFDSSDRILSDNSVLRLAKRHLDSMVFVGNSTNVPKFLDRITEILDVRLNTAVDAPINVTANRPAAKEIPASIRKMIEQHNSLDMEIYEYALSVIAKQEVRSERKRFSQAKAAIRYTGPDTIPSPRCQAIVSDPTYKQIEGWLPPNSIDFVSALTALRPDGDQPACLMGIRPFHGQALIGIGQAIPNLRQIHAAGFEDDHPRYAHSFRSQAICEANLRKFFPDTTIRIAARGVNLDNEGVAAEINPITVGIIARPYSRHTVMCELSLIEKYLEETGLVIVDEVFNPLWPQAAEGLFGWLSPTRKLVPFMSGRGSGVWLCRPKLRVIFENRLRGLQGITWDDVCLRDGRVLTQYQH